MIKKWKKFNESNSVDNFVSIIEDIRSYFIEFEDINSISYLMFVIGTNFPGSNEDTMLWSFTPDRFDDVLRLIKDEATKYLKNTTYTVGKKGQWEDLFKKGGSRFGQYPFCLQVTVNLSGVPEIWGSQNILISDEGVSMLEDLLVTYRRLKSSYNKVILDLNSSDSKYKPAKIKVYFNPIVD
jgi:hypothetical protein